MKKLILASFFTLAAAVAGYAQKFELGGNIGFGHTSANGYNSFTPVFSMKGMFNINEHFQVGINGDVRWITYEVISQPLLFEDNYPSFSSYMPGPVYMSTTQAVHTLGVFANTKRRAGNAELYAGLSAGIAKGLRKEQAFLDYSALESGYTLGVQAGFSYFVTQSFGINAEVGGQYLDMSGRGDYNRDGNKTRLNALTLPVNVGVRYRLFCPCSPHCPVRKTATNDNK